LQYLLPAAPVGARIGLLGGSFDPAHAGHVNLTLAALRHLRLDQVWWLVSPGNPLKALGPAPMPTRMAAARSIMQHPKVTVTDAEAVLGTRYTAATLRGLQHHFPARKFVWLMGADNLTQLEQWDQWHWIMENVPIAVFARPGQRMSALHSKAARQYRDARVDPCNAPLLADLAAPAWAFLNIPMRAEASSRIRAAGRWPS
jgi:nicotinate-nucleotide adenylyltransferase